MGTLLSLGGCALCFVKMHSQCYAAVGEVFVSLAFLLLFSRTGWSCSPDHSMGGWWLYFSSRGMVFHHLIVVWVSDSATLPGLLFFKKVVSAFWFFHSLVCRTWLLSFLLHSPLHWQFTRPYITLQKFTFPISTEQYSYSTARVFALRPPARGEPWLLHSTALWPLTQPLLLLCFSCLQNKDDNKNSPSEGCFEEEMKKKSWV